MDKTQLLERYFNTFINQEHPKQFFIGLKDYLDYGNNIPEFDYITSSISNQASPLFKRHEQQIRIALEKVKEVHKEINSYIQKHKIKDENITKSLKDYDDFLNERAHGNRPLAVFLYDHLSEIVQSLHSLPEHKKFAEKYVEYLRPDKVHISRYIHLKELDELYEIKDEIERGKY